MKKWCRHRRCFRRAKVHRFCMGAGWSHLCQKHDRERQEALHRMTLTVADVAEHMARIEAGV